VHAFLPPRARLRPLIESRLPDALREKLAADSYDLVLVNDIVLLPVIGHLPESSRAVHVDLHEYHAPDLDPAMRGATLANGFHRWTRAWIGDPRIRSRSTVARGIAELYRDEFSVSEPFLIRNCPPREQIEPAPVANDRVELVYHGVAAWERGLRTVIDAMALLSDRFRLNLILVGSEQQLTEVTSATAALGARARIFPPVPVTQIASRINDYDLEVMFYPPATANLRFALPNKLFEAVQARLGVVIGESPMMAEIVREYGNGLIVSGWAAADLAAALETLAADDIEAFKRGSDAGAAELNSEHEREVFRKVIAQFEVERD
jgi:glycosyltransferase involved in cell wall biosynthesis